MKDFFLRIWKRIRGIRFGWGVLFALYTFAVYARLLKILGSTFIGAIVLYLALCFVASIMRRKASPTA